MVFIRQYLSHLLSLQTNIMETNEEKDFISHQANNSSRRDFLFQASTLSVGLAVASTLKAKGMPIDKFDVAQPGAITISLTVNGKKKTLELDPRVTLLDALRETMKMPGTKKGCDRGQCGACTVLVDGRRINSCLTLVAMCDGAEVTTIEGLGTEDRLHPMQEAFLKHDAFQCGYCTPGQICSAVGMLQEGHIKNDMDIKELMSGNLCRCGAYQNILDAIKEVQHSI